jgi:hypothetical protein
MSPLAHSFSKPLGKASSLRPFRDPTLHIYLVLRSLFSFMFRLPVAIIAPF